MAARTTSAPKPRNNLKKPKNKALPRNDTEDKKKGWNYDSVGIVDVVRDYPWTMSKQLNRNDIPEILLTEHRADESSIKRQILFWGKGFGGQVLDTIGGALNTLNNYINPFKWIQNGAKAVGLLSNKEGASKLLEVYQDIFPDNPTGNKYYFPYFSKTFLELTSPNWEQLDDIGGSIDKLLKGGGDLVSGITGNPKYSQIGENLASLRQSANDAYETFLKTQYPVVGIFDRPRIFTSHNEREITIDFPLYNTIDADAWKANRDLIYMMMTQFLYLKNSYITGYPPVFYRVLIPGEYFSYASCVTNFKVTNLGNIRKLYGFNVPDAYQISLSLREMCMPSLNQFQAMTTGEAAEKVNVTIEGGVAPGARDLAAPNRVAF